MTRCDSRVCANFLNHKPHKLHIMKEYYKEMEIFEYAGQDWQVVSVRNIHPHSVGEDEIEYITMNRHGKLKNIMDREVCEYNLSQMGMA